MQNADSREGYVVGVASRWYMGTLLSAQFCYKPNTALKNKSFKKKRRKTYYHQRSNSKTDNRLFDRNNRIQQTAKQYFQRTERTYLPISRIRRCTQQNCPSEPEGKLLRDVES